MSFIRTLLGVYLTFALGSTAQAALTFQGVNAQNLGEDFVFENEQFRGNWRDSRGWDGYLCDGYYQYLIHVQGRNEAIDFEVKDENTMLVKADLRDLYVRGDGTYKSSGTACLPVSGWLGLGADSVLVEGYVVLGGASLEDIKIKITGTKFGTIHMGTWVPRWFEDFATDMANRALRRVWASRLGEWLNAKITKVLKEKVPHLQRN